MHVGSVSSVRPQCRGFLLVGIVLRLIDALGRESQSASAEAGHGESNPQGMIPAAVVDTAKDIDNPRMGAGPEEEDLTTGLDSAESALAQCSAQEDLVQLVLGVRESQLIRAGEPEVTSIVTEGVPPACERWRGEKNCCTSAFFDAAADLAEDEQRRMVAIRDAYEHLVEDQIKPVAQVKSTADRERQQVDSIVNQVMQSGVVEVVTGYILGCEDQIRLHFSTMICELCDPSIWSKLFEKRYLEVDGSSCNHLWHKGSDEQAPVNDSPETHKGATGTRGANENTSASAWAADCRNKGGGAECLLTCRQAPGMLMSAARSLESAVESLLQLAQERPSSGKASEAQRRAERAHDWLRGATRRMKALSVRIKFYEKKKLFCDRVAAEGYRYDPTRFGDLDKLHPGYASFRSGLAIVPDGSDPKGKDTDAHDSPKPADESQAEQVDSADDDQPPGSSAESCVHGEMVTEASGAGQRCVCHACWIGVACDRPMKAGPMPGQLLSPLVANGELQSITLVGCELPFDANSLMAHVALVRTSVYGQSVDPDTQTSGAGLESASFSVDGPIGQNAADLQPLDLAACSRVDAETEFQDLRGQVPFFAAETHLEWQLLVPMSSEGRFVVCFCSGPCGYADGTRAHWFRVGHVFIASASSVHPEEPNFATRQAGWENGSPEDQLSDASCDEGWTQLDEPSISFFRSGHKVLFYCRKGFVDMVGPSALQCRDGQWYVDDVPASYEEEVSAAADVASEELPPGKAAKVLKVAKEEATPPKQMPQQTLRLWADHEPPFQMPRCHVERAVPLAQCDEPTSGFTGGEMFQGEPGVLRYRCLKGGTIEVNDLEIRGKTLERFCISSPGKGKGHWEPSQEPVCKQTVYNKSDEPIYVVEGGAGVVSAMSNLPKDPESPDAEDGHRKPLSPAAMMEKGAIGSFLEIDAAVDSHETLTSGTQALPLQQRLKAAPSERAPLGGVSDVARGDIEQPKNRMGDNGQRVRLRLDVPPDADARYKNHLQIQRWPVRFTDDELQDRFIPEFCWTALECADMNITEHTAASDRFARAPLPAGRGFAMMEIFVLVCMVLVICVGFAFAGGRFISSKIVFDGPQDLEPWAARQ